MATTRVIVTFLHEAEESIASKYLSVQQRGERMLVGWMDDSKLAELRDAGLIVEELPSSEYLESTGFCVPSPLEGFSGPLPAVPATIEIAASGPIQPGWLRELEALGLREIERSGGDKLRFHMGDEPATLRQVAAFDWVMGVRAILKDKDKVPIFRSPAPRPINGPALPSDDRDPAWDVRVPDAVHGGWVKDWARENGFEVVGASARRVRLRIPPGREEALNQLALEATPYIAPTLHNDCARTLIGVGTGARVRVGATEVTLTGRNQRVGVADTGLDASHPDFTGRIANLIARGRPGNPSDPNGHGTHVAGTILGSGSASGGTYQGVAPQAELVLQSLLDPLGRLGGLPVDLGELFTEAHNAGVRIHNNSWGAAVQSRYTGESDDVDLFVSAHPEMLIVISAGNEGSSVVDPQLPARLEAGRAQPLSLGSPATSKNALVVGASRTSRTTGGLAANRYSVAFGPSFPVSGAAVDIAQETISGNPEQLAGFSSRGPCDNRRIKPDVVAPGTDIVSTRSATAPSSNYWGTVAGQPYAYMGGTSMAAPVVSGLAALVREYYVQHRGVTEPSAALLKATLINGTRVLTGADAGGPIPNPHQGFGCVHLSTTLPSRDGVRLAFLDIPADSGFTAPLTMRRYKFTVVAPGELRICMAFTDPAARGLQNDLDLVVEPPGLPRRKILGNADLVGRLTRSDSENNVEIVRVENAAQGEWTVGVTCRNLLRGQQGFALVVLGNLDSEVLT